jgi:hypothetical protein
MPRPRVIILSVVVFFCVALFAIFATFYVYYNSLPAKLANSLHDDGATFYPRDRSYHWEFTNLQTGRKITAQTVVRTENDVLVCDFSTLDWNGVPSGYDITESVLGLFIYIDGYGDNMPVELRIQYPIVLNNKWKSKAMGWPFVELENRIETIETIQTDIGPLDCVQISTHHKVQNGEYTSRYWYAKGYGLVKFSKLDGEFVVTKFEQAK